VLGKVAQGALWLYHHEDDIRAYIDPPKPMKELRDAVDDPQPGYQIHHIVEQTPAKQDGYPDYMIHGRDNLVRIPRLKHEEITAWFATKNEDFGGPPLVNI
jgi:hypothetical protein